MEDGGTVQPDSTEKKNTGMGQEKIQRPQGKDYSNEQGHSAANTITWKIIIKK